MNIWGRIKYLLIFSKSVASLNVKLIWGMLKLTKMTQPAVTVFGGSRIEIEDDVAQQAASLAKSLVERGYSIITGGGPGIMEAANFGAMAYVAECQRSGKKDCPVFVSGGVGVIHLNQEKVNQYVQTSIIMDHFFSRKWLLVRYSSAFVFFEGGFGTLDEFFEVITLKQTNKMPPYPIILVGSYYWEPLLEWINSRALVRNLVAKGDEKLFIVVDDVDLAVAAIERYHGR
jgi:uncharacterized protein (TIGR00730 family)